MAANLEHRLKLAKEHAKASRYEEALALCDEVLRDDSEDPEPWRVKAYVLKRSGDTSGAVEAVSRAIALNRELGDLWLRGRWYVDIGQYESAIQDASELLRLGEEEATDYYRRSAHLTRAVAYYYQGDAARCREECEKVPPDSVYWARGMLHTIEMLKRGS